LKEYHVITFQQLAEGSMGRGLSEQQRAILAVGVAHNAARHGGEPQAQALFRDLPVGTELDGYPSTWHTRERAVMVAGWPELTEPFVLVALGGYRRQESYARRWVGRYARRSPMTVAEKKWAREKGKNPDEREPSFEVRGYEVYGGAKWRPETVNHKRRVSLARSLEALAERELLVLAPQLHWFCGPTLFRAAGDRSGWTAEQVDAAELGESMPEELQRWWRRGHRWCGRWVLLPEAFDVVGDAWRSWDAGEVLEHWHEAEPASRPRAAAAAASG
jgi:hypothetical protein